MPRRSTFKQAPNEVRMLDSAVKTPKVRLTRKAPIAAVWTANKARLIQRYLYYFVLITKHGTYIDAFAGPQRPGDSDSWAAKLVLDSEPRWLQRVIMMEIKKSKYSLLTSMIASQPTKWISKSGKWKVNRKIQPLFGDANILIPTLLDEGNIRPKQATFCLLDQHTFECDWATVQSLASYKPEGHSKIELFYFLANSWLNRAETNTIKKATLDKWWGDSSWKKLVKLRGVDRALLAENRFRDELGYKYVTSWPIYRSASDRTIMFYMIHASDHPDAPKLMERAYNNAVNAPETLEQLLIEFPKSRRKQHLKDL